MIRVTLPAHLRTLAGVNGEVQVEVGQPACIAGVLDAIEARYPVLGGTIRDRRSGRRRPFIRFFAGEEDLSHDPTDQPLPAAVASGSEPLHIVGAMAGG